MHAHWTLYLGVMAAIAVIWLVPISIEKAAHVVHHRAEMPTARIATPPIIGTDEMASRPVFLAGRRPLPVAAIAKPQLLQAAVPPAVVPTTDGIVLVGTMLTEGHNLALIRSGASPTATLLAKGQAIGPWTVDEIAFDHIRLRTGSHVADLKFSASAYASGNTSPSVRSASLPQRWMPPGPNLFPASSFPK